MKEIAKEEVYDIDSGVLEIYTATCPNCKTMQEAIKNTKAYKDQSTNFYKCIVTDDDPVVAGMKIATVPTILFMKNGRMNQFRTGVMPVKDIDDMIEKFCK